LTVKPHPIKVAIDAVCKLHGLSLSAVAKRAGVSRETLYRVMRGDGKTATVATICGIARAIGVAPIILLREIYHDLDMGVATLLPVTQDGDHISFIADVTVPDGCMVLAGQTFVKTWMLQNTGNMPWVGRKLRCVDSELVTAKWVVRGGNRVLVEDISPGIKPARISVTIPATESGKSVSISVKFRAPVLPCDAISRWKMVDENGELCFPKHSGVWCAVSVMSI
jgi:transcriptional regulator with XRE-family HTH domain